MADVANADRMSRPAPPPEAWTQAGADKSLRLLAVCQAGSLEERLRRAARALELDILFARSFPGALQNLQERFHDVVIVAMLDGVTGARDFVRDVRRVNEETVVVIAAPGSEYERLADALVEGAYDFLPDDADEARLRLMLGRAVEHARLRRRSERLERALDVQTATLRRRLEELAVLNGLTHDMQSVPDLDAVLRLALRRILEALDAECGSVLILDAPAGELVVRAAEGRASDQLIGERRRLGEGVSGTVARERNPVLITDIQRDSRFRAVALNGSGLRHYDSPSCLAVPVLHHGVLLGELNASGKRTGEPFTPDDLRLVSTLVGHMASAISGALAAEELRRANEALRINVSAAHERLDVTNDRLARAEGIADSIVLSLPAAVAAFDSDLRITFANDAARTLLHLSPGDSLRDRAASTGPAALADMAVESLESGSARRLRCPVQHGAPGEAAILDVVVAPLRLPDGRVSGGTVVATAGRCPLTRLQENEENPQ